ncbi:MAG: TonB-dependent receptor [Bacteroidales bacterium]|nr:TonB-dependent receptor [Bacteroidales bacterium]
MKKCKNNAAIQAAIIMATLPVSATALGETEREAPRKQLEHIVVTATRTDIEKKNAPTGYSEVSRSDIDRKMASTLAEMVQDVPGVALDNEMDGRSQIRIRGFTPSQTLILINGRRINNTDVLQGHSDFRMTQIPTAAIERVEVVRGPTSSLYGADALGGVVNAILRPPSDTWAGRVQARTGVVDNDDNAQENGLSLYSSGPVTSTIGALLSVDVIDRDGTLNPDEPGVDEIEGGESLNGLGSLFYRPSESHEFELFFMGSDDQRRARQGASATRAVDIFRYSSGVRYDYSGSQWTSRFDVYRSRSETESLHLGREEQHTDDIVDLSGSWQWSANHVLTLGADYREEHFWRRTHGTLENDDTVEHSGALIQHRSNLLDDRLIVTLGTRFDDHTNYTGEISPRAGVVFALSDNTRLKADYGQGFSAPDLRRSDADYDFTFTTIPLRILGNADLEPERSESFSVALEHETDQVQTSITLFRNDITDLIDLRCIEHCPPGDPPPGENEVRIYTNVDSAITQGVELAYSQQLTPVASVHANYTYLDTENEQTGEALEKRPRERINLSLILSPWHQGELNLRSEYTGPQLRGDEWTQDYTLFHLGVTQRLGTQWQLRGGVNNLTDQRLADIDDNYTNEIRGRYYYLAVDWEF